VGDACGAIVAIGSRASARPTPCHDCARATAGDTPALREDASSEKMKLGACVGGHSLHAGDTARVAPRSRVSPLASRSMPPADPAEAVELLHRQLMELEVLEAMYPREGDAGVEVLNPTAADAARAAVDAWESSGEPPTDAVLRAIPPLRAALTLHVPGGDGDDRGAVTLRATLPHGYPHEAPALELSASILPRDVAADVLEKLRALADERTAALRDDSTECLMDLAQEAQDAAAAAAAAWARDRPAASSCEAAAADDDECHAVIRIDHMNDSSGYVKKLQRWCAQLGLAARLFYALPGGGAGFSAGGDDDPEASAERFRGSGSVGPPPGGRVEGVFVVLGGDGDSVQTFLTRLRTEMVDVDAKGNKCRERQSTTLCRRRADRTKTGQERVPNFDGFECERYVGGNDALERLLARFNLLHVGAGTERFQAKGA